METMLASTVVLATIALIGGLTYLGLKGAKALLSDMLASRNSSRASGRRARSAAGEVDRSTSSETAETVLPTQRPVFGKARTRGPVAAPLDPTEASTKDAALPGSAAYWQEQAKRSDDKHKSEIRAHVERAVTPISVEGAEALEHSQVVRLAIKHVFPPRLPQRSMSYFGGHPIVPPNFDWPTIHNREGLLERLHFMAQIDCSEIPRGPGRDLLPDKGYLYFFAPLADTLGSDASHFVTRYAPGPVKAKWEPLEVGLIGAIHRNNEIEDILFGKRSHLDRCEITFGWIDEPSDDEISDRSDEGHLHEILEKIRNEKENDFFGQPLRQSSSLRPPQGGGDTPWLPYPGFPANWKAARLLRKFLEAYVSEERGDIERRLMDLGEVADDHPEAVRLCDLQRGLSEFTSKMFMPFFPTINAGHKDHDAPPEEVKRAILDFTERVRVNGIPSSKQRHFGHLRLPSLVDKWMSAAAIHGAEAGLVESDGAALIPPKVVDTLSSRHGARKHQMLGLGEVVQVAADDMKERYVLLLQLGPDEALDWLIGDMGPLQYWITPDDLAARRFANTVLTIEAY